MDCFKDLEWRKDIFGYNRLVLTPQLALKSIEFADLNYNYDIQHWEGKGWIDCTLIRDGIITKDCKRWSRDLKPIERMLRIISEVYTTNSSKVIVLGGKVSKNNYVIGISFSGTVYEPEWLNNLKVKIKNGFHEGFIELSECFDNLADKIKFPKLSDEAGEIKTLTLSDILLEASKKESRFRIWVTGHSQGAGVAISYAVNCLSRRLVHDENILCVTIAPPTVAMKSVSLNTTNYPIYNIINDEDIVTHLGSQIRFGIDVCYTPDEQFRLKFYSNYNNSKYHDSMKEAYDIVMSIKDTPCAIELAHALQRVLTDYRNKENNIDKRFRIKVLKRLRTYLVLGWFSNQMAADNAYMEMTGHTIDEEKIKYWINMLLLFKDDDKLAGLIEFTTQAHMLNFEQFHTFGPEHCYRGIIKYAWNNTKFRYWDTGGETLSHTVIDSLWPDTPKDNSIGKKKSTIADIFGKLFGLSKK